MASRSRSFKSTTPAKKPEALYDDAPGPQLARQRRRRRLFLRRILDREGQNRQLEGDQQDRCFEIVQKWAELERKGHLPTFTETSVDATFLNEVFGEGLGYPRKTDSPDAYELDIKFTVPGVGIADAALGAFPKASAPVAVIELKGSRTDLDRDKSNGRTAVQQCWDYLNAIEDCPWGIVSNFSTIRLYHRLRGSQAYEEFTLQEMCRRARFNEFYAVFERGGLLRPGLGRTTRAIKLLTETGEREQEVGDDLYEAYQRCRNDLILHLHREKRLTPDQSIHAAQKLLDRIVFIAFCEDRGLLPRDSLEQAYESVPTFSKVTNPRWHNVLALFHQVDKGGRGVDLDVGFNGGLFKSDPLVDELELPDAPWTERFRKLGEFDYRDEVNVDVLGHLFERSITEIEKLRVGGVKAITAVTNGNGEAAPSPSMPKSAQRKRFGVYYTPPAFTGLIVERTVDRIVGERWEALAKQYGVDVDTGRELGASGAKGAMAPGDAKGAVNGAYWKACIDAMRDIKVIDPACGSGAFLIQAYESLEERYHWAIDGLAVAQGLKLDAVQALQIQASAWILNDNLFGVDLSEEAVEITQLALWIRTARKGQSLADLSRNIVCGNSLVSDPAVHPRALDWHTRFPAIFARDGDAAGFDCVIGNPPWERMKVQEREFFALVDPGIASAVSAADRRKRIAALPEKDPELFQRFRAAKDAADAALEYARKSGRYPLTGKGDVNTYMLFAELARSLVAPRGIVGLIVPSGIATDQSSEDFFGGLIGERRLVSLYDFENKAPVFEDVHRSFKFSVIVFGGASRVSKQADFIFFAHRVEETRHGRGSRHIQLSAEDLELFNPNTRTCPIFRSRRDAELTREIYRRVPVLHDRRRKTGGNPWGVRFVRMFDQTNDAEKFRPADEWEGDGFKLEGNRFVKGTSAALPLYEAKMVQAFDHRAASVAVAAGNWVRQGQKEETSPVEHANPEFSVMPRWWVAEKDVTAALKGDERPAYLAFKDVTSPTNQRTMIAAFVPRVALTNSAPLILPDPKLSPRRVACLLANLNSLVYDYMARQKVGGLHLNYFVVEQIPTFPPERYDEPCPWSTSAKGGRSEKKETLEQWISERVLKLTCTSEDMIPLAEACGFKGSRGDGVHIWRDSERDTLRAELDAAFAHLYGLSEADVAHVRSAFPSLDSE